MSLVPIDLDAKYVVLLTIRFGDLPEHGLRFRCRRTNENNSSLGRSDSIRALRFPLGIEGVLDGVVVEFDVVVLVLSLLHEKISCPLVFHLKADERSGFRHLILPRRSRS